MKLEQLQKVLDDHKAWLRDASLSRADLRGADLRDASLSRADLRGADLTGADLSYAYLNSAYLRGAYLRGANLRGANLRGASLSRADLSYADLTGADLTGADLRGAGIIDCGQRSDGYQFFIHLTAKDGPMLIAGCRYFTLSDARAHWAKARPEGTRLGDESRALLDHGERMMDIANEGEWE